MKKKVLYDKKFLIRMIIEITVSVLFAVIVELIFNFPAITAGYSPRGIYENHISKKGKLVYTLDLDEPVYINKLIIQGTTTTDTSYQVQAVTVNDFDTEEDLDIKDYLYTELEAGFTPVKANVRELKIIFSHPDYVNLQGISYSNEVSFNKYRMLFFALICFLGILVLVERKLLLNRLWLLYLLCAVGFGTIFAVTSGTFAVTWDEAFWYG